MPWHPLARSSREGNHEGMEIQSERSLARIDIRDLLRLAEIAAAVEANLFAPHPGRGTLRRAAQFAGEVVWPPDSASR